MGGSYDQALATLGSGVERLSQQRQAALFTVCGRALQPLYRSFYLRSGWGDPDVLERALATAWQYALDGRFRQAPGLVAALAKIAPHADDFDAPASSFAQDAVICADAALQAATGGEVDPAWIEYALEPLVTSIALRELGVIDVGSSAADEAWRDALPDNPEIARAIASLSDAIDALATWDGADRERAKATTVSLSGALVPASVKIASDT